MKSQKILSLSFLALALCSVAIAAEYKSPEVGFKAHAAPSKEMKTAEFGDHYRVEDGKTTDRQIASKEDEEVSDRDPASMKAKAKKKDFVPETKEEPQAFEAPKPWMRSDDRFGH